MSVCLFVSASLGVCVWEIGVTVKRKNERGPCWEGDREEGQQAQKEKEG